MAIVLEKKLFGLFGLSSFVHLGDLFNSRLVFYNNIFVEMLRRITNLVFMVRASQGSPSLKGESVEWRPWVGPSLHGFDGPIHGHH